jgi:hypothetical protein
VSLNINSQEIYLCGRGDKQNKNKAAVLMLKEKSIEDQLNDFLEQGRIKESNLFFLNRVTKDMPNFEQRKRQYNQAAAWSLIKFQTEGIDISSHLKESFPIADPREWILLFKELYDSSPTLKV